MNSNTIILGIGAGVAAEIIAFLLLRYLIGLGAKTTAMILALGVFLVYVPWAILTWPGGDVFSMQLAIYLLVAYMTSIIGGSNGKEWHWGPALIVGFFVVVISTNVVFLSLAEHGVSGLFAELLPETRDGRKADFRFPGTVSHDFQEKEALYNAYLKKAEQQRQRGWKIKKGWLEKPVAGKPAVFMLEVRDRHGEVISDAEVNGSFLRASNSADDFDFVMRPAGDGRYQSEVSMPWPGIWRLILNIKQGEDTHEVRASTSVLTVDGN